MLKLAIVSSGGPVQKLKIVIQIIGKSKYVVGQINIHKGDTLALRRDIDWHGNLSLCRLQEGIVLTTHSVLLQCVQTQQSQTWLQAHWELIKCLQ